MPADTAARSKPTCAARTRATWCGSSAPPSRWCGWARAGHPAQGRAPRASTATSSATTREGPAPAAGADRVLRGRRARRVRRVATRGWRGDGGDAAGPGVDPAPAPPRRGAPGPVPAGAPRSGGDAADRPAAPTGRCRPRSRRASSGCSTSWGGRARRPDGARRGAAGARSPGSSSSISTCSRPARAADAESLAAVRDAGGGGPGRLPRPHGRGRLRAAARRRGRRPRCATAGAAGGRVWRLRAEMGPGPEARGDLLRHAHPGIRRRSRRSRSRRRAGG